MKIQNLCESRMHRTIRMVLLLLFLSFNMVCSRDVSLLNLTPGLSCRLIGGLTRDQRALCHEEPDAVAVAVEGLQLAVRECQHQFRWHRWNCSTLMLKSFNPHSMAIMRKGYRETSFLYALTAAGVAHSLARACAAGRLLYCGCDPLRPSTTRGKKINKWEWSGCSHNLAYGIEFSKKFLDVREKVDDLQSRVNLHNNRAGRTILSSHMEVRCKCHGLSGSCQLQTCWRATPDFRVVASSIKRQYRRALKVAEEDLNKGLPRLRGRPRGRRRGRARLPAQSSLMYFEESPTFCESDPRVDSPGTTGRRCRTGSTSRQGSCDTLCCGRGHNIVHKTQLKYCNCKFVWCCDVKCQTCKEEKWIAMCK